jgi:hypothetical protein
MIIQLMGADLIRDLKFTIIIEINGRAARFEKAAKVGYLLFSQSRPKK